MSGQPAYHGWTHRPKSEGGTDPIPITAGVQPISALAIAGSRSQELDGVLDLHYDVLYRNDPSFGYSDAVSSRPRFITLTTAGWYKGQFTVFWDESDDDFLATDFPIIAPTCDFEGSPDDLVNAIDIHWDDTTFSIYTDQRSADDALHKTLVATVYFNFDPEFLEITTFGIGCQIQSAGSAVTKRFGGQLVLTRLGEILEQVTIT